ncbi:MAG: hypothetical protein DRP47_12845 [Candidatus Zixiibacteriota bacterium]|nr:MAG: hypothetical protein DRP47_12845 [candidate division Zixibacteria bacterium]
MKKGIDRIKKRLKVSVSLVDFNLLTLSVVISILIWDELGCIGQPNSPLNGTLNRFYGNENEDGPSSGGYQ